jgi:hypothetical protein
MFSSSLTSSYQGCLNGCPMVKFIVRTSANVCARPHLPCGCDFIRGQFLPSVLVKIRPGGPNTSARTHSLPPSLPSLPFFSPPLPSPPLSPLSCPVRTRTLEKNKNKIYLYIFLVVIAGWKRKKK